MRARTILIVLAVPLATLAVMAATSANYTIQPAEFDNGGGKATGPNYVLQASIGGNVIAGTAGGASYTHAADYLAMLETATSGAAPGLQLSTGPNNPLDSNEAASATSIPMLQLQLTASGASDVTVTGLTVNASGTGLDNSGVNMIHLYVDGDSDGAIDAASSPFASSPAAPYLADDGNFTFALGRTITAGNSETWLVVYDFTVAASGTFIVSLASGDITAVDTVPNPVSASGGPVTGGTKTVGMGGAGTLTLAIGPANLAGGDHFGPGQTGAVFQFQLSASSVEAIDVTGFTFRATGTANDPDDIDEIKVFIDAGADGAENWYGTPLDAKFDPFPGDNGEMTVNFAAEQIAASGSQTFLAMVLIDPDTMGGQTFGLSLTGTAALGVTSATAPTLAGLPVGSSITIDLAPPPPPTVTEKAGGCAGSPKGGGSPLGPVFLLIAATLAFRAARRRARREPAAR
ncbi:MAG: hypothetical protein ACYS47_18450 [Planctomycetota bacterium]